MGQAACKNLKRHQPRSTVPRDIIEENDEDLIDTNLLIYHPKLQQPGHQPHVHTVGPGQEGELGPESEDLDYKLILLKQISLISTMATTIAATMVRETVAILAQMHRGAGVPTQGCIKFTYPTIQH